MEQPKKKSAAQKKAQKEFSKKSKHVSRLVKEGESLKQARKIVFK